MAQTYSDKPTLEAWNALAEAASGAGNCRIVIGTYAGNGTYGSSNPLRFTFDGVPVIFILAQSSSANGQYTARFAVAYGTNNLIYDYSAGKNVINLSWPEHAISWYGTENAGAAYNYQGFYYRYIALVKTDE